MHKPNSDDLLATVAPIICQDRSVAGRNGACFDANFGFSKRKSGIGGKSFDASIESQEKIESCMTFHM